MNRLVLDIIERYNMIEQGDRILVALSGGADSVALLHFLYANKAALGITVEALHLNHNLRGQESERDEHFVKELCSDMGVPLTVESEQIQTLAQAAGISLELCGREYRYAFFARQMLLRGAKLATAHTGSDNAETMLLNLVRGTGLRGLGGIPPVRQTQQGLIIRPFIFCTRAQIEAYCAEHGLVYVNDSSNQSDDYTRNRLRHRVLPVLKEINPTCEDAFCAAAELLRTDEEHLEDCAARELEKLCEPEGYSQTGILLLPKAIAPRVLRMQLAEAGLAYDRERINLLWELLLKGQGTVQLSGRIYFWCDGQRYHFAGKEPLQPYFEIKMDWRELAEKGNCHFFEAFCGKTLQILFCDYETYKKILQNAPNQFKNALDCDKIDKVVFLRQRKSGDSLRPAGRGCTKTLRKLFNEAQTPLPQRHRAFVLESGGRPVWAEGFGVDETAVVTPAAKRIAVVSWEVE